MCLCVCVHVCLSVCTHTCVCVEEDLDCSAMLFLCVCACVFVCECTHPCMCWGGLGLLCSTILVNVCMCVCLCVHTCVCVEEDMGLFCSAILVHVCMCVCECTHLCMCWRGLELFCFAILVRVCMCVCLWVHTPVYMSKRLGTVLLCYSLSCSLGSGFLTESGASPIVSSHSPRDPSTSDPQSSGVIGTHVATSNISHGWWGSNLGLHACSAVAPIHSGDSSTLLLPCKWWNLK